MSNKATTTTVLTAGVDWITATCNHPVLRAEFWELGNQLLEREQEAGHKCSPVGGHGYVGRRSGALAIGERPADCMITATGEAANENVQFITSLATGVSRLDLQTTAHVERGEALEIGEALADVADQPRKCNRIPKRLAIIGDAGECTLYWGSPKSDKRARLYRKDIEEPGRWPTYTWRWELQARARLAKHLADRIAGDPEYRAASSAIVFDQFDAYGWRPRWAPFSSGVSTSVPRARSTADRRLTWIREQVTPAFLWAIGNGSDQNRADAMAIVMTWLRSLLASGSYSAPGPTPCDTAGSRDAWIASDGRGRTWAMRRTTRQTAGAVLTVAPSGTSDGPPPGGASLNASPWPNTTRSGTMAPATLSVA